MRGTPPDYGSPKKPITTLQEDEQEDDMLHMVPTSKRAQRDLALKICGFDYSKSELEQELVR